MIVTLCTGADSIKQLPDLETFLKIKKILLQGGSDKTDQLGALLIWGLIAIKERIWWNPVKGLCQCGIFCSHENIPFSCLITTILAALRSKGQYNIHLTYQEI